VRDYFDLLGLSITARATEIRRRTALHPRRWHPDFAVGSADKPVERVEAFRTDAAVDFVSMSAFVDRMQRAFFGDEPRRPSALPR
jgi:hypothetical protein